MAISQNLSNKGHFGDQSKSIQQRPFSIYAIITTKPTNLQFILAITMSFLNCMCPPSNLRDVDDDTSPTTILTKSPSKARSSIHDSILETIGRTPIVRLAPHSKTNPTESNIYLKLESENPGGSVKDRLSIALIEWAEQTGKLEKGQTVVEASSGNTGIGIAMVCAQKGYPYVCVMAESFSIERRKLMRFLGAKVIVSIFLLLLTISFLE
jgi:hypothetical protein